MGSILHIKSQLNTERTHLHPEAVLRLIERGEPVPLGERGERRWAIASAITLIEQEDHRDGGHSRTSSAPRATRSSTPNATTRVSSRPRPVAVP